MSKPPAPTSPFSGSLAEIAAESLKLLIPVEPPAGGIIPHGGYCAVTHAKICQMKFIGLSDAATAKALKISLGTLRAWKSRYPKLRCDMEAACELSNAHAAALLRKMREGPRIVRLRRDSPWRTLMTRMKGSRLSSDQ